MWKHFNDGRESITVTAALTNEEFAWICSNIRATNIDYTLIHETELSKVVKVTSQKNHTILRLTHYG